MSSATQLQDISTQLTEYYTQVQTFLSTPASAVPSFEDYVELLKYEDILTEAVAGRNLSASFATGALMDIVHFVLAIKREFAMRASTKSDYYGDSELDLQATLTGLQAWYGKYYNYLRATSPLQAKTG
jgi:hypothetical protein